MKIIKQGEIPNYTKRFACKYCGSVFEAEKGEYQIASQIEYIMDGTVCKTTCPVCKNTVFINSRGK